MVYESMWHPSPRRIGCLAVTAVISALTWPSPGLGPSHKVVEKGVSATSPPTDQLCDCGVFLSLSVLQGPVLSRESYNLPCRVWELKCVSCFTLSLNNVGTISEAAP